MTLFRSIAVDLARALCVVALLVFGVTAAPPAPVQLGASPAVATALALSASGLLCGGGFGDDHAHTACHACRSGVPLVPAPPCVALPVAFAAGAVAYAPATALLVDIPADTRPPARGPPATHFSV